MTTAEHVRFVAPVTAARVIHLARACGQETVDVRMDRHCLEQLVGVSDGRLAAETTLCFVDKAPSEGAIERLERTLVITNSTLASKLVDCPLVVVPDPRATFIDLLTALQQMPGFSCFTTRVETLPAIDSSALIHKTAVIETDVYIGPHARVSAGCVIKRGTWIGRDVMVRENTVLGGAGIALYKARDGRLLRFPDLAGVVIEDGVQIGTSCSIPAGVLTSTFVGRDSVIGNLCNIGHGARIGAKVWMSVGALIGGNTSIGAGSTLGLGVAVRDNVTIGADCSVGMGSVVTRSVPSGVSVFGNPARCLPHVVAGPER